MAPRNGHGPDEPLLLALPAAHEPPFIKKKTGEIIPVFANVVTLLRENFLAWGLGYDEFSNRMFTGDEYLEDKHFLEITEWVQRKGVLAGYDVVCSAVQRIARERQFHQIRDYLELLEWDGEGRINNMLLTYAGAEDNVLVRAQSCKWMIQAVARVFEPGCQADATLVFEGAQGLGKSSFFRVLFGDKWFTDHLPDLTSKDALLQLRGVWCVEIAELATFTKADAKRINQFLTSRIDRYRDPYGRLVADYPRQNVFAGTVNPGAGGYLKDETGARRFWSVPTSDNMRLDKLADDRDQLWAEALARYKSGEPWYLNNRVSANAAATAQAERYVGDAWQETIEAFIDGKPSVTLDEIFTDCLHISAKADWGQKEQNRIAGCLAHAGWSRYRKPRDGKKPRSWCYKLSGPTSDTGTKAILGPEVGPEYENNDNELL